MKRSHQLGIAIAALVAALVLFFWPRSASAGVVEGAHKAASEAVSASGFEQNCEQSMRTSIKVSAAPTSYVLINNLSTQVLKTRGTYASASHSLMGMTSSRTRIDVAIDGATLVDRAHGRECIAPKIDVELRFEPLDVYVAREFPPQSCAFREVFKHEMQHVRIYTEQLQRIEGLVRSELLNRYQGHPLYTAEGDSLRILQEQIDGWLPALLHAEMAKVELMQQRLDQADETDKLSHACMGEVASMMGSSF